MVCIKYHIDTIPIWDSLKLNSECPLCVLKRHLELEEVNKFLGASVMDPDTRIKVNEKGFCKKHQSLLINGSNRLGLALMMESHIDKIKPEILKAIKDTAKAISNKKLISLGKNAQLQDSIGKESDKLKSISETCILCEKLDSHMQRYVATFLEIWKNESTFRDAFKSSKGLCLEHISQVLSLSFKHLPSKEGEEFCNTLYDLTKINFERQEDELKLFIKKFDYRFNDFPWSNSKDSVERLINRLQGWCVGIEPHPDDRNKDKKF